MSQEYSYQGRPVEIARTADIRRDMRPDGRFASLVQIVLNGTKWVPGGPIETLQFDRAHVLPTAVEVQPGVQRVWAFHSGHRARHPKKSPFVVQDVSREDIGFVTVELAGTPDEPLLVRAYGGDYMPPLPWMISAESADGGMQACKEYWLTHAYLLTNYALLRQGSIRHTNVPDWYAAIQG